jgi:predicted PurR-regulated permease PerM
MRAGAGKWVLLAAAAGVLVVAPTLPLLVFATILFGVLLRSLAEPLAARTRLPEGVALAIVLVVMLALPVAGGALLAPSVKRDLATVSEALPRLAERGRAVVRSTEWGRTVLRSAESTASEEGATIAARAVSVPVGLLSGLVIVAVGGSFLAAQPRLYRRGLVALVPAARRPLAVTVLLDMGDALRMFLLGRVVSMVAVGVLTAVALSILGAPLAVPVGAVVGLVTFVPYLGPLVGTVPVAVAALVEGPATLAWAIGAYAAIQWAEGFILTPIVQQKAVSLPAALTLGAEVAMGYVFGPLGVVVAVPLAAVTLVATKRLWVERVADAPAARAAPDDVGEAIRAGDDEEARCPDDEPAPGSASRRDPPLPPH